MKKHYVRFFIVFFGLAGVNRHRPDASFRPTDRKDPVRVCRSRKGPPGRHLQSQPSKRSRPKGTCY